MRNSDFDDADVPLQMEELIGDAIEQILRDENPQHFVRWMSEHIQDYHTGPQNWQTGLFDAEPERPVSGHDQLVFTPEIAQVLAAALARSIWNGMPLPSHHFRTRPIPLPKRNDPCLCGSGKKFKKCCDGMPGIPKLATADLWPIVYAKLPKDVAAQAVSENHIPIEALNMIALEFMDADQPKKMVTLLQPLFEGKLSKTGDDAEYAFTLLCDVYDHLGHAKKKRDLINTVINTATRSPLRSGAWQRLAAVRMDRNDTDGAWKAFKNAQRDDPESLGLCILELQLLHAAGREDEVKDRALFWQHRLRRGGIDDDEPPLNFVNAVAKDPEDTFRSLDMQATGDLGQKLFAWLESVQHRALPEYTLSVEGQTDDEQHMSLLPSEEMASLEVEWHSVFLLEKPFSVDEFPRSEYDPWLPEEEQAWSSWLHAHPAAFDSFDILDDLATAYFLHPNMGAAWMHQSVFEPILGRADAILEKNLATLAASETPLLAWIVPYNRPVLRSLARLVLLPMMNNRREEAMQRAQRLIALNPTDNHGFRSYVINQLLIDGKDPEALALAGCYPDDVTPDIAFGRVLALYRQGELKQAVYQLGEALEYLPEVPRNLIAKRIKQPLLDPDGITVGGDDQAWYYREDMRDVWNETPGALDWLKKATEAFR